jgi:hypothetical protein
MAKSQTARSTIKNDPFETLIPDRVSERANAEQEAEAQQLSRDQAEEPPANVTPIRREQAASPARSEQGPSERTRGDQAEPKKVDGQKREKLTVHLSHDLIERVKNAAYWNPRLTIASIAELGVKYAIEQVEKEHGGPYPPREAELKGGRPIGS